MPPLYDNIGDALALTQDGQEYTVSLDTAGATFENNEATEGEGWEGVWVKVDLSTYPAGDLVEILVELQKTGGDAGYEPYVDTMKVVDGTFDPNAPDFTKLDFPFGTGDQYVGDGTSNPSGTITLEGGTGVSTGIRSLDGIFYIILTDWNFVGYGQVDLTYTVPPQPYFSDPTVDVNTGGGTASVVSGAVRETSITDPEDTGNTLFPGITDLVWTFKVSGAELPPDGRYRVYLRIKDTASDSFNNFPVCLVRRNSFPLTPTYFQTDGGVSNVPAAYAWKELTDQVSDASYKSDFKGPNLIPVLAGDEFEFCLSTVDWGGGGANDIDVESVMWIPVEFGGMAAPPIAVLDIPDIPAGATDLTDVPNLLYDPGNGTFGHKDLCVTDDDTVWVMFNEGRASGETHPARAALWKWDGSWTLVDDDPFGVGGDGTFPINGTTTGRIDHFSIDTDGEDIFVVFGKSTGIIGSGPNPNAQNYEVHVRKYDVSGASWSTMGSALQPLAPSTYASHPGDYDSGTPQIKCSPAGVPWITFGQNNPAVGVFVAQFPYVFRWDGSDWEDTEIPAPVNPHTDANPDGDDISPIDVNSHVCIDLTFCQADGPNENPSTVYNVWFDTTPGDPYDTDKPSGTFVYGEYDGTPGGWTAEQFNFSDYYPAAFFFNTAPTSNKDTWQQGMALVNDGSVPIFAAALGSGLGAVEGALALKRAGADWAPFPGNPGAYPTRPMDAHVGIWVDPSGADIVCDSDGNAWLSIDSNTWYGQGAWMHLNLKDDGTGGGVAWAGWGNNGTGLINDIPGMNKTYAKGTTIYALTEGSAPDYGHFSPMLWIMPRSAEVYIPWRPAAGVLSLSHLRVANRYGDRVTVR